MSLLLWKFDSENLESQKTIISKKSASCMECLKFHPFANLEKMIAIKYFQISFEIHLKSFPYPEWKFYVMLPLCMDILYSDLKYIGFTLKKTSKYRDLYSRITEKYHQSATFGHLQYLYADHCGRVTLLKFF